MTDRISRPLFRTAWLIAFAGLLFLAYRISAGLAATRNESGNTAAIDNTAAEPESHVQQNHPVTINAAKSPEGVLTSLNEYHGQAVMVSCQNCHSVHPANPANRQASDLNEFHQGLKFQHGQLACVACHNANDGYQSLHLADGTTVSYADTMQLCAQCHGTQFRDYQHGSHGGMTGYWDLTRGPRQRNHCIDCHDPHSPQYPGVHPAAKPRDRFSPASKESHHE